MWDWSLGALIEVLVLGVPGAWACGQIATRYALPRQPLMAVGFIFNFAAVLVLYVRIRFRAQRTTGLI